MAASERSDFEAAYALLSSELRARYTPETLARDFGEEPLAKERLARARLSLAAPAERAGGEVRFPIGEGRALRLVPEGAGYRVAAIE